MDTPKDVLKRVRSRIEKGWCKGCYAKDKEGAGVWVGDKSAVEWCLTGAIAAETGRDECVANELYVGTVEFLYNKAKILNREFMIVGEGLVRFNDHPRTTKQDVLKLIDKTINEQ